jgi:hypothetical protein
MTAGETTPIAWPRVRWFHWVLLALILAASAGIRWDRIDKQSLWIDEYWALYLATGRGNHVFEIPHGVILDPPPNVGFAGAPAWPHIWTGLSSATHPPLYFLVLRAWIDFFGDSDRAIRSMSAVFSLAGIVVLFSLVRRIRGPGAGLIAAGIMAFAPMQIDYSQTTRPYTLLVFFALLFCHALLSIQLRGPTRRRAILLGGSAMAMALTHYFSAGAILGAMVYTMIRLTGKTRTTAFAAIAAGLLLAALVWGPFLWKIRGSFNAFPDFATASGNRLDSIARAVVTMPAQIFLEPGGSWNCLQALPLAIFVYVGPLLLARKSPEILLWWLWIVGTIGLLLAIDILRGTTLVGVIRYSFIISPAIFIIFATLLPEHWLGNLVSLGALTCAIIYGVDRLQIGPAPTQDWKTLTRLTNQSAGPHDIIAFVGSYDFEPGFDYVIMSHYAGRWTRPVMFLTDRPNRAVMGQLAARGRVWVIGHDPVAETGRLFPGWLPVGEHSAGIGDWLWAVIPPASEKYDLRK